MINANTRNFDYIIAGGGHAGCVLASRLSEKFPDCTIALVEAGKDAHENPLVQSSFGAPQLHGTELQWNDMTAPQPGADNRPIYHGGGKMLSGGSAANYATWVRGHETCYDEWARSVGDDRWSYQSLLPCFKRTETHSKKEEDCPNPAAHGFDGPIHVVEAPKYPLGPTLFEATQQAGHKAIADMNGGSPIGVARWNHNWKNKDGTYFRQPAGQEYDLSKVNVLTETFVHKIVIEEDGATGKPKATGIDIGNDRILRANREVIVSCGGLRTPQVLMLSGLGPASHLLGHGITPILDLPDVGANLHDHCSAMLFWKLKHPEKGLAIGHPDFDIQGMAPSEYLLTGTVPSSILDRAIAADSSVSGITESEPHPHTSQLRAHYELTFGYFAAGAPPGVLPTDGSIVTTGVSNWLPTSRGSITLKSGNVLDAPVIDPQYLVTEHDRCITREAIRELMRIMTTTPAARAEIDSQFQLPNTPALSLESSDEDIDERVQKSCITWFHPGGTAAMGKVVDSECKVIGVEGLRVVDASVLPNPLSAHYQVPVYALAERAAEIIAGEI